jgi:hypothetical protein
MIKYICFLIVFLTMRAVMMNFILHSSKFSNIPGIMDEIKAKIANNTPFDHVQFQYIIDTRKNWCKIDTPNTHVHIISS